MAAIQAHGSDLVNLVRHIVGPLAENAFIVAADGGGECVVIDPGAEADRLLADIRRIGLRVRYVLVTHGHGDHTGAVAPLQGALGGEFCAHPGDRDQIEKPIPWIVAMLPDFAQPPPIDRELADGDRLAFDGGEIEVIATPGHTPGSVSYRYEAAVFTGDTLFRGSIGRYDFPGGDGEQEVASIRERLLSLPDETRVLPGHGSYTTIGDERRKNPHLRQ